MYLMYLCGFFVYVCANVSKYLCAFLCIVCMCLFVCIFVYLCMFVCVCFLLLLPFHTFKSRSLTRVIYLPFMVCIQQFPSVVVSYTLKAMQYQSQSATQQFPRLLQIVEQYPDSLDAFLKKVCFLCVCVLMYLMHCSHLHLY